MVEKKEEIWACDGTMELLCQIYFSVVCLPLEQIDILLEEHEDRDGNWVSSEQYLCTMYKVILAGTCAQVASLPLTSCFCWK